MSTGTKKITEHFDIFGSPVLVGMYVAVSRQNTIKICKVTKLNNKMIHVMPIPAVKYIDEYLVYSKETVIIHSEDALVFIMKNI